MFKILWLFVSYRQDLLDDSYVPSPHKGNNIQAIQGSTNPKQKFEVFARDANKKDLKIRHVSIKISTECSKAVFNIDFVLPPTFFYILLNCFLHRKYCHQGT